MKCIHTVKGMSFHAFHGVMEVERELGQVYFVDVTIDFGLDPADISEKDEPVIRDAGVFEITRNIMMATKFRSISSLACTIASGLLEQYEKALSATVSINKKQLFIPGNVDSCLTEVEITRSDFEAGKTGKR